MSIGADGHQGVPAIEVRFDRADRRYPPGGALAVRYRIGGLQPDAVRALEVSVAWYTEGKGEEDLAVHAFERIGDRDRLRLALEAGTLETVLPPSPLSYEGVIVKIRWCVRLRVFYAAGRDYVSEHVFELGSVPVAHPHAAEAPP